MISQIINPHEEAELDPVMRAVMDAGIRGLDRLKWDLAAGKMPEGA